jgi:hypothetical protein
MVLRLISTVLFTLITPNAIKLFTHIIIIILKLKFQQLLRHLFLIAEFSCSDSDLFCVILQICIEESLFMNLTSVITLTFNLILTTVTGYMCSILQACIEECFDIDQDLLDILLSPLLPSSKAENPVAYKCVGTVLRQTAGCIQASVSAFINHVLVGTVIPGKATSSELADHIYPLIFELHKISPGLLLRVLPNICVQLQAEEEDTRLKAVKLLGQLFASQHADYATDFHRNFKDFLGRFVDMSSVVRLEMVDSGSMIMKKKLPHRAAIEGNFRLGLKSDYMLYYLH